MRAVALLERAAGRDNERAGRIIGPGRPESALETAFGPFMTLTKLRRFGTNVPI